MSDGASLDVATTSLATLKSLEVHPWDALCLRAQRHQGFELTTAVVRIIPTLHPEEPAGVLCLHPLLHDFLVRSLDMVSTSDESRTEDNGGASLRVAITTAGLRSTTYKYEWTVQRLPRVVDDNSTTLTLSLTCICADTPQKPKWIARALEDRIVMDNTILVLPTESGGDALFLLSIQQQQESSSSTAGTAYRLGTDEEFTVTLNSSSAVNNCIENDIDSIKEDDYEDCPGYESVLQELKALFRIEGKAAASGVLLTGCAGVGKTRMASCLSHSLSGISAHSVSVHDMLLRASWATESDLVHLLLDPFREGKPLLILDDLDVLGGEENTTETSEPRHDPELIVTKNAIIQAIDQLTARNYYCSVLGLTQDARMLPKEFTCLGRLEKQVSMIPSTQWQRELILTDLLKDVKGDSEQIRNWVEALGPITCGCVAADLVRLCADAWTRACATASTSDSAAHAAGDAATLSIPPISWQDLREAAQRCVPSQLAQLDVVKTPAWPQEIAHDFHQIHEWSWRNFGGYVETKKRLYRTVVAPWRRFLASSEQGGDGYKILESKHIGVPPPSGVLFHGPPGTGKSVAASCLASSLGLPVVKIRASQVMDQWLGGSEATVRSLFARARAASPCILFFDEIDAIATNRDNDLDGGDVSSRLLSTFLNEMDGVSSSDGRGGVLVVAASNRLDALDAALLRPGRLEEHVFLSLPTASDIQHILRIHLARMPLDQDVELGKIARSLGELNASGAEVEGLCRLLCLNVTRYKLGSSSFCIAQADLEGTMKSWRKGLSRNLKPNRVHCQLISIVNGD